MYCPRCLTEYQEGFSKCPDCRVPLAGEVRPEPERDPNLELVTVLEANDSFALTLAKASLEEVGINYVVSSDESQQPTMFGPGPTPFLNWSFRILVARKCESEARALLEPLQNPDPFHDEAEPEQ